MSDMIQIQINPNLRIDRVYTVADLATDVRGGTPHELQSVQVFEPTSGLVGRGWVTSVDAEEGTVSLLVDWANLFIPENRGIGSLGSFTVGKSSSALTAPRLVS